MSSAAGSVATTNTVASFFDLETLPTPALCIISAYLATCSKDIELLRDYLATKTYENRYVAAYSQEQKRYVLIAIVETADTVSKQVFQAGFVIYNFQAASSGDAPEVCHENLPMLTKFWLDRQKFCTRRVSLAATVKSIPMLSGQSDRFQGMLKLAQDNLKYVQALVAKGATIALSVDYQLRARSYAAEAAKLL
jgi:hypothetical protein